MYYEEPMPVAGPNGKKMSAKDMNAEKERRCVMQALSLLAQVQELNVMKGDEISKHPKAMKLIKQARQHLDDMIGDAGEKEEPEELPPAFKASMA